MNCPTCQAPSQSAPWANDHIWCDVCRKLSPEDPYILEVKRKISDTEALLAKFESVSENNAADLSLKATCRSIKKRLLRLNQELAEHADIPHQSDSAATESIGDSGPDHGLVVDGTKGEL